MKILSLLLVFVGCMIYSTANWIPRKFGEVTYEQIIFHLNVPLDSEIELVYSYLQNTLFVSIVVTIVLYFAVRKISPGRCLFFSFGFFVCFVILSCHRLNISRLVDEYRNRYIVGNFYEQYYVNPYLTQITAPEHKRNLIMIFAESMETTYAQEAYFGDNLIPELQALAKENINFSHNNHFGGFTSIDGAHYTQASMVTQLCAVPFRLPIEYRRYRPSGGFMPKALCLSDILNKDSYNQSFMIGMSKEFAGTDKFLETHGKSKILDWDLYSKRDNLPEKTDKKRKRIVRDNLLFEYAKEELLELSRAGKPFAFTMMTMDTHFGNEHFDKKNCPVKYHDKNGKIKDEEYFKNVVSCSSQRIAAFVDWVKEQPFYDNTEIVIVGDHLTMSSEIFNESMDRKVYNVYINSNFLTTPYAKNRKFSALDTMPTVLESMGYTIEGHKLGLGVSLFSGEPTLLERMDVDVLNEELQKQSAVYNKLLYGKALP